MLAVEGTAHPVPLSSRAPTCSLPAQWQKTQLAKELACFPFSRKENRIPGFVSLFTPAARKLRQI